MGRDVELFVAAAAHDSANWTGAQYANAVLLLLNSPHSAVSKQKLEIQLGRHVTNDVSKQQLQGEAVLAALVKAQRLVLRRYSGWALDIPHDAYQFDNDKLDDIVTAPSPVELYCVKCIRPQLERTLQVWKQQQQKQQVCTVLL